MKQLEECVSCDLSHVGKLSLVLDENQCLTKGECIHKQLTKAWK
jgi:hypothetical protein